jgi:hypothetical protein
MSDASPEACSPSAALAAASSDMAHGSGEPLKTSKPKPHYASSAADYLVRGLFPIPAKGIKGKQPKFRHKYRPNDPDLWTREKAHDFSRWHECEALGLLLDGVRDDQSASDLRGLLVLDFDAKPLYVTFAGKYAELMTCPLVSTAKGFHAYFLRSPLCNALQLTDGARQFEDENHVKLDLDIKSYTKSGAEGHSTAGFISVPPSEGKAWVRDICDTPVREISDELVTHLYGLRVANKKRKAELGRTASCSEKDDEMVDAPCETVDDHSVAAPAAKRAAPEAKWWHLSPERVWDLSLPCLREMGFKAPDQMAPINMPNAVCRDAGYVVGVEFFDPVGTQSSPCVVCGKEDNHANNAFWMMLREKEDGTFGRFVLNYSANCVPNGFHSAAELPFSARGARSWSQHFLDGEGKLDQEVFDSVKHAVFSRAEFSKNDWPPSCAWLLGSRLVFGSSADQSSYRVVDLSLSDGRLKVYACREPWKVLGGAFDFFVPHPLELMSALDADLLRHRGLRP